MADHVTVIHGSHRRLLVVYHNGKELLRAFEDKDEPCGDLSTDEQGKARDARTSHLHRLRLALGAVMGEDLTASLPAHIMGPSFANYTKFSLAQLVDLVRQLIVDLEATCEAFPSTANGPVDTQGRYADFKSLPIIGVPVGYIIEQPDTPSQVVYAYLSTEGMAFVDSENHGIRPQDIMLFTQAHNLGYQKEILYRNQLSTALRKAVLMSPRPASYAELAAAHEDLTKVPVLVSELGKLGVLGEISAEQKDAFAEEKRELIKELSGPIKKFFSVLRGDERRSLALLVRAVATLQAIMTGNKEAREIIEQGMTDRWLWRTMKKIAVLSTEKITFDMSVDKQDWVEWIFEQESILAWPRTPVQDAFFLGLGEDFLPIKIWDKITLLCPIAAHQPLESPPSMDEVLRRGLLTGHFHPQPTHRRDGIVMRQLHPIWTENWDVCMDDLFPSTAGRPRPLLKVQLPPCIPTFVSEEQRPP